MDLSDSFFLTTLIQARIPSLPLEFWHEDICKGIASSFGELVALDNATAARTKLHSARLYVKMVDLNHLSKLGKRTQEIIFEDLLNSCYTYKKLGHMVKNCLNKSKNQSKIEKEVKKTKV